MSLKEKINEILRELGISRKEFEKKLRELRSHFEDLIDEETLILLTAYHFGYERINSVAETAFKKGKVILKGIIDYITEPKEIKLKDGEKTLFATGVLRDETGSIKIHFWNDVVELIKTGELIEGDLVKVKGFIRRKEAPVISVRDPTDVEVIKRKIESLECYVYAVQEIGGKVKALLVANDRTLVAIARDEVAEEITKLSDKVVKLKGVQRENIVFVECIESFEEAKKKPRLCFTPIEKVLPLTYLNVKGRISGIEEIRRIRGKQMAELYISDETGRIRLSLWDENVEFFKKADIGDYVKIFNGHSRIGWDGEIEIYCGVSTFIVLRKSNL